MGGRRQKSERPRGGVGRNILGGEFPDDVLCHVTYTLPRVHRCSGGRESAADATTLDPREGRTINDRSSPPVSRGQAFMPGRLSFLLQSCSNVGSGSFAFFRFGLRVDEALALGDEETRFRAMTDEWDDLCCRGDRR